MRISEFSKCAAAYAWSLPRPNICLLAGTVSSFHLHIAVLMLLIRALNPKDIITPKHISSAHALETKISLAVAQDTLSAPVPKCQSPYDQCTPPRH